MIYSQLLQCCNKSLCGICFLLCSCLSILYPFPYIAQNQLVSVKSLLGFSTRITLNLQVNLGRMNCKIGDVYVFLYAPWAPFPGPACGIKLNLIRACMPCSVASVMSTLCDPSGYTLPGSSVHVVLQVRILEWVAIFPSRGSSQPRDWTQISCIAGRFFTTEPLGKPSQSLDLSRFTLWSDGYIFPLGLFLSDKILIWYRK